jgi:hypothetical protein
MHNSKEVFILSNFKYTLEREESVVVMTIEENEVMSEPVHFKVNRNVD